MDQPLISVIIPTFNRASSTIAAVLSVLNQSYSNIELTVVDDGSTDGTVEKLESIEDKRFCFLQIPNAGVSRARNLGVEKSRADLIAFLDSDDEWHRDKLAKQIDYHNKYPEISISQTQEIWIRNGRRVNPRNKHLKPQGYIFPQSLELCTITPSSVLMSRQLFLSENGFDERMPACEDYDLWLRITARHQIGLVDEYLMTRHGGHEDQLSTKYAAMDRFRIYSLGKVLLTGYLNELQKKQVKEVMERKLEILIAGAKKRNRETDGLATLMYKVLKKNVSLNAFQHQAERLLLGKDP